MEDERRWRALGFLVVRCICQSGAAEAPDPNFNKNEKEGDKVRNRKRGEALGKPIAPN